MFSLSEKNEYDNALVGFGYSKLAVPLEFTICNWGAICDDDYVSLDLKKNFTKSIETFKATV